MRSIKEIEKARAACGVSKAALCAAAMVHVATYRRLVIEENSPTLRTLGRLDRALEELITAKREALEAA